MNASDINPFIRFCDIIPSPIASESFFKAYDCRIFYIISGNGVFFIKDTKYNFKANSLFFIASGTEYKFSYDLSDRVEFFSVNFDFTQNHSSAIKEMAPDESPLFNAEKLIACECNDIMPDVLFVEDFSKARDEFLDMFDEFVKKRPLYKEKSSSILKTILIDILRIIKSDSVMQIPIIVRNVSEYIKQHYQEDITGALLGQIFGYHPYHISRTFKSYTGNTIHQYLINQRIKVAKKLLIHSELNINEIALSVGIDNQAHFTQCFKNITGTTPSFFRFKAKNDDMKKSL